MNNPIPPIPPPFDAHAFVFWLERQTDLWSFKLTGSAMWRDAPSGADPFNDILFPPTAGHDGWVVPVCGETPEAQRLLTMRHGGTLVAVGVHDRLEDVDWRGDAAAKVVLRAVHWVQHHENDGVYRKGVGGHKNLASAPALTVSVTMLGGGHGEIIVEPGDPAFEPLAAKLREHIRVAFAQPGKQRRVGGPTAETEERFKLFERIKKQHPQWTQERVAQEANKELPGASLTADSVANAYRAMGGKWRPCRGGKP